MTLDEARARYPTFGFAIFAMDPKEPVVLEVYLSDGYTKQWRGTSEADVLAKAFPPPPPPEPTGGVFD